MKALELKSSFDYKDKFLAMLYVEINLMSDFPKTPSTK